MKRMIALLAAVAMLAALAACTPLQPRERSIEELGSTIEQAGLFWQDWWYHQGRFAEEHMEELPDNMPDYLPQRAWARLLPSSGFAHVNQIRDHLLQLYTDEQLARTEFPVVFYQYGDTLYVCVTRAGFSRPDWNTAMHELVEQRDGYAVVNTTVLVGSWHRQPEDAHEVPVTFRTTLRDGRVDAQEELV